MFNREFNNIKRLVASFFFVVMAVFCVWQIAESSYLPTTGSNIGIGTTTPVGALTVMSGNVGVGTWSPTALLQVAGTISATSFSGDGSGLSNIAGTNSGWTDGGTNVYTSTTTDNVGIGTTTPASTLTILGNVGLGTMLPYRTIAGPNNGMIVEGNVGIGTWNPSSRLQLVGVNTSATPAMLISAGSLSVTGQDNNGYQITLGSSGAIFSTASGAFSSAANMTISGNEGNLNLRALSSSTNGNIVFYTVSSAGERMRLASSGNLGVGTINPASRLIVNGGVGIGTLSESAFLATSAPVGGLIVEKNVGIGTNAPVGALTVMNGNVGIGTWSPTAALQVTGGILQVPDGSSTAPSLVMGTDITDGISHSGNSINFSFDGALAGRINQGGFFTGTGGNGLPLMQPNSATLTNVSFGFVGDPNMGMYRASADNLALITSGVEQIRITDTGSIGLGTTTPLGGTVIMNGNVGIGTWSPIGQLEVKGGSGATRIWTGSGTDTNATSAGELYVEGDLEVDGTIYGDGSGITSLSSTLPAGGWTDGGTNIYLTTTTDNVAIGTTTPASTLTVLGNIGLGTTLPYRTIAGPNNGMIVEGNVGIGTWNPSSQLQVRGVDSSSTPAALVSAGSLHLTGINNNGYTLTMASSAGGTIAATGAGSFIATARMSVSSLGGNLTLNATNGSSNGNIIFNLQNAEYMRFSSTANLGIGTLDPASRLAVNGGVGIGTLSQSSFLLTSAPVGGLIVEKNVGIGTNAPVGALTVLNGNVGIGTWSPIGQLEVKGGSGAARIWTGSGTDTNATSAGELYVEGDLEVDGTIYGDGSGLTSLPSTVSAGGWLDGGTNVYTSTTTDNVGIGTTTPNAATLEIVKNAAQPALKVSASATGSGDYFIVNSQGNVGIGTIAPRAGLSVLSGNVGFGTTSPSVNLEVFGSNDVAARITSISNLGTSLSFQRPSQRVWSIGMSSSSLTANAFSIDDNNSNGIDFYIVPGGNVGIATAFPLGGLSVMNGNVGIGTWNPINTLSVKGNIGIGTTLPYLRIAGPNNGMVVEGNVGIGTWEPSSALQVVGTVAATAFSGDGSALTNLPSSGGWTDGGSNVYTSTTTDNVGIGTTTPNAATLEIVKNANQHPLKVSSSDTGSGDYFFVNSAGNVGIGTTTASEVLTVNGNIFMPGSRTVYQSAAAAFQLGWTSGGPITLVTGTAASAHINLQNYGTNNAIRFLSSTDERMRVTYAGNVGVGTSDPVSKLVVNGGVGIGTLGLSSFLATAAPVGGLIVEKNVGIGTTAPVGALTVMNGNVGIGTWSPTHDLQVVGTVAATAFSGDGSALTNLPASGGWSDGGSNIYTTTTTDNVGIGTTTPNAATLEIVKNAAQPALKVSASATGSGDYFIINSQGNVGIGTTDTASEGFSIMNGNVGIGTWKPVSGYRLVVNGGITNSGDFSTSSNSYVSNYFPYLVAAPFAMWLRNVSYKFEFRNVSGIPVVVIDNEGNTGIGTLTPINKLTVFGGVGIGTSTTATSSLFTTFQAPAGGLIVEKNVGIGTTTPVGGLTVMNGNVGIGTWSPVAAFEVAGGDSGDILLSNTADLSWRTTAGIPFNVLTLHSDNVTYLDGFSGIQLRPSSGVVAVNIASTGNVGIGTTTSVGGLVVLNGNVGIGTWSPIGQLEVKGGSGATRIWTGSGTDTNATSAGELYVEGDLEVDGTIYGDGSGITSLASTLPAGGWTDGGSNLYLTTTTDNVAIGTTTPASTLTILGNVGLGTTLPYRTIAGPNNGMIVEGNVGIGTWSTGGAKLIVDGGNVGIGTENPGGLTHISGTPLASATSALLQVTGPATGFAGGHSSGQMFGINAASGFTGNLMTVAANGSTKMEIRSDGSLIYAPNGAGGSQYTFGVTLGGGVVSFFTSQTMSVATDRVTINPSAVSNASGTIGMFNVTIPDSTSSTAGFTGIRVNKTGSGTGTGPKRLFDLQIAGDSKFVVDAQVGNVGIGTFESASRLSINGGVGIGTLGQSSFLTTSAPVGGLIVEKNVGIGTTTPVGALTVMNGNVGVGTWSPTHDLQVVGTVAATAFSGDGSALTNLPSSGGWTDGGTNVYTSTTTDNVGIGTTTPASTLTLLGNIGIGTTLPYRTIAGPNNGMIVEGNVGIGTWNPTQKVEVNVGSSGMLKVSGNTFASKMEITNGGGVYWSFGTVANPSNMFTLSSAGGTNNIDTVDRDFVFYSSATNPEIMRIKYSNGNVGIGTFQPASRFIVNGGVGIGTLSQSSFLATAAPVGGLIVEKNVGIGTNAPVGALTVMNGNVGVGTWSPTQALQVVGTVAATAFTGDGSGLTGISAGGWTDGGTNVYTSTTTDNVGIGTTTPNAATLEIVKNAAQPLLKLSSSPTGSGDYLFVNSSGCVGIGTIAPRAALVVFGGNVGIGTTNPQTGFQVENTGVFLRSSTRVGGGGSFSTSNTAGLTIASANDGYVSTFIEKRTTQTADLLRVGLNGGLGELMVVKADGKVGIGTFSPGSLFVSAGGVSIGSSQAYTTLAAPMNGLMVQGNVGIGTTAAAGSLIVASGNVGIGTTEPVGALTVMNGNVGIGTFVPTGILHIKGDSGLRIEESNNLRILELVPPTNGGNARFNNVGTSAGYSWGNSSRGTLTTLQGDGNWGIGTTAPRGALTVINGNVGIGTTDPSQKLEVYGSVVASGNIESLGALGTSGAYLYDTGSTGVVGAFSTGGSARDLIMTGKNLIFYSGNSYLEHMRVDTNGNVGIGTSTPVAGLSVMNGNVGIGTWSPTQKLHVVGTVAATAFTGDGSGLTGISAGGWTDGGTNVYASTTTDLVAIGTTTPASALTIKGNIGVGTTLPYQTLAAPANGMIVEGNVGIGTFEAAGGKVLISGGNVGIATFLPGATLDVGGTVRSIGNIQSVTSTTMTSLSSSGGNSIINFGSTATPDLFLKIGAYSSRNNLYTQNRDLYLYSSTVDEGIVLKASSGNVGIGTSTPVAGLSVMNGNVGIGTTSPITNFEIFGNSDVDQTITSNTNHGVLVHFSRPSQRIWRIGMSSSSPTANAFSIDDANASGFEFMIVPGGNVGIGTTTPVAGLSVMNGNVGIGTWSPTQALQVVGTVTATAFSGDGSALTNISAGGWTDGGTNVYTSTTTDNVGIGTTRPNAATLEVVKNAAQPTFKVSSSAMANGDFLVVDSAGNVGIGTITPQEKLHVNGLIFSQGNSANSGYAIMGSDGNSYWTITRASNTNDLMFNRYNGVWNLGSVVIGNASGNVGIGTTTPVGALTVMNGNVGIGTWSPVGALEVKATGSAQVTINGASGGCLMFRDTDNAGWTECNALNGVLTCSIDADGICDGV